MAKYDEIKNTIRLVAASEERRRRDEGEMLKRERIRARERSLAGPSPQGVSHARGNTRNRKTNIGADK